MTYYIITALVLLLVWTGWPVVRGTSSRLEKGRFVLAVGASLATLVAVFVYRVPIVFPLLATLVFMSWTVPASWRPPVRPFTLLVTVSVGAMLFFAFRPDPEAIERYVRASPERASYAQTVGTSQSMATEHGAVPIGDVVSLAVAFEWAMQVAEGNIQPNASVPLDVVERHVVSSDPEHEAWVATLDGATHVSMREVARGMMNGSHAATDYWINVLGASAINERMRAVSETTHSAIVPLDGATVLYDSYEAEGDRPQTFDTLANTAFETQAIRLSQDVHDGTLSLDRDDARTRDISAVWKRRARAEASHYTALLARATSEQMPPRAAEAFQSLLVSRDGRYTKRSVLPNGFALVASGTREDGEPVYVALFLDRLNPWERWKASYNADRFLDRLFHGERTLSIT